MGRISKTAQPVRRRRGDPGIAGADRFVVQSVHMLLEGDHQRPWKDGEPRTSRLVFIGRNLPKDALREGFNRAISPEAKVH